MIRRVLRRARERLRAARAGSVVARPLPWTRYLFEQGEGSRDLELNRRCDCGEPAHVLRLSRPPDARRFDGEPLSELGPWVQCACGRWKEAL